MERNDIITQINNIKKRLTDLEKELEQIMIEGTDSSGMITAVVNGKGIIKDYRFNPGQISSIKKESLIQAVVEASNNGLEKAREIEASKRKAIVGDVNIPDIPGLF